MKKLSFLYLFLMAIMAVFVISCDDGDVYDNPDEGNQETYEKPDEVYSETLIEQLNTNLSSLQDIVTAYQNKETISKIDTLFNDGEEIGYVITLVGGRNFTIYKPDTSFNGSIPAISVRPDKKYYYWTLNGEDILDFNGNNRIVKSYGYQSPKLKIENGNWNISFDGGKTWKEIGKVDGEKGGCIFSSVVREDITVSFTLADGISVITLPIYVELVINEGALPGLFSVSDTKKVRFSRGNLQYRASTKVWRFAESQCDYIGEGNSLMSETYDGWIDLFGWATSGYHDELDEYNLHYQPWSNSFGKVDSLNQYGYGPSLDRIDINLVGTSKNYDWGVYNPILNGGNKSGLWRTLSSDESSYLFKRRPDADNKYALVTIEGYCKGLIILPDVWGLPEGCSFVPGMPEGFSTNIYSYDEWKKMEAAGAVLLPAAGYRGSTGVEWIDSRGRYWLSTHYGSTSVFAAMISYHDEDGIKPINGLIRAGGISVRLVQDAE